MTLRISTTQVYKGQAVLVPSVGNETDGFESAVNVALELIRSTNIGNELLSAIEGAGHEVLIVKAGENQDNNTVQSSQGEPACDAACYQEVLNTRQLFNKIQSLLDAGTIQPTNPALNKFKKFFIENAAYKITHKRADGKRFSNMPLAHKQKDDRPHSTDAGLRSRIMSFDEEPSITEGKSLVGYLQNGLVGYHIMDHLTRGLGTGAWVVWDPLLRKVGTNLPADKQAAWMDRPPSIALAHELIHAWRLVCGCCVFRPRVSEYYYEEAMTVGIPPYDKCRFTENRLRHLKGLPLRTFYGEETRNQSKHAALKHGATGSKFKFTIKVVGSGPKDPLVFDYEIRSLVKPEKISSSGKTNTEGHAEAQGMDDSEIRFRGVGPFGRVETHWLKMLANRYLTLQFGRYRFICEPLGFEQ